MRSPDPRGEKLHQGGAFFGVTIVARLHTKKAFSGTLRRLKSHEVTLSRLKSPQVAFSGLK